LRHRLLGIAVLGREADTKNWLLCSDCPGVEPAEAGTVCPRYGSRYFSRTSTVNAPVRGAIYLKHKRPGVGDYMTELFQGWQPTKALGGIVIGSVLKLLRIDRGSSPPWIRERVVNEEDGTVIRDVSEPLDQHRGRGSARKK
jgi:hypothetical protein